MKKILIGLSLLSSLLLADKIDIPKEKVNNIFKLDKIDSELKGLKESFIKDTGDNNYDKYLSEAVKDYNWKLANYMYKYESSPSKINYNKQDLVLLTPKYKESLDLFAISSKQGNMISAYEGLMILEKYFLISGENDITKKYLKIFSETLKNKNYCIGYLYNGRSNLKKYSDNPNYKEAQKTFEEGINHCYNKENIPDYYIKALKEESIKSSTMIKVTDSKNKLKEGK